MINHGSPEIASVFVVVLAIFGPAGVSADRFERLTNDCGLRDESFSEEIRLRSYFKCARVGERGAMAYFVRPFKASSRAKPTCCSLADDQTPPADEIDTMRETRGKNRGLARHSIWLL